MVLDVTEDSSLALMEEDLPESDLSVGKEECKCPSEVLTSPLVGLLQLVMASAELKSVSHMYHFMLFYAHVFILHS